MWPSPTLAQCGQDAQPITYVQPSFPCLLVCYKSKCELLCSHKPSAKREVIKLPSFAITLGPHFLFDKPRPLFPTACLERERDYQPRSWVLWGQCLSACIAPSIMGPCSLTGPTSMQIINNNGKNSIFLVLPTVLQTATDTCFVNTLQASGGISRPPDNKTCLGFILCLSMIVQELKPFYGLATPWATRGEQFSSSLGSLWKAVRFHSLMSVMTNVLAERSVSDYKRELITPGVLWWV